MILPKDIEDNNNKPIAYAQYYMGEYNNLFEPDSYVIAKRAYTPLEHFTYEPLFNSSAVIDLLIADAVAKEREACAIACLQITGTVSQFPTSKDCITHNQALNDCANAIRHRNNK